jgi:hypothetical protein
MVTYQVCLIIKYLYQANHINNEEANMPFDNFNPELP